MEIPLHSTIRGEGGASDAPVQQDLSLETTLTHLSHFLTRNIVQHYPPSTIATLHSRIRHHLTPKLAPTWDPLNPSSGCGVRSLIAMPGRFPTPLVQAAVESGVDPVVWARKMSEGGEWQVWVDPGSICWRDGGWVWVEEGYERERVYKQTLHTVWQTPLVPSNTDDYVPNSSSSRSVSSPFPMAANSATAALQKNQLRQQQHPQQQSQHPQLDTQPSQAHGGGVGGQALRAPAVFRIPVAPFPFPPPASSVPSLPVKQLGSLSLRDGNDAAVVVVTPGQRVVRRSMLQQQQPSTATTTLGDASHGGVIGMGFATSSSSSASPFAGSGLLEGGAPLVKRGTTMNRNTSLPSTSIAAAQQRSPMTPGTTVSVTTSSNLPTPPFGSGIPGQPGSGVPTSAPLSSSGNEYLPHTHGYAPPPPPLQPPVKRHHLKNWTEAEPNRLVARSKARPGKGGEKVSKDETKTVASSTSTLTTTTAATTTMKSGTYPALGRRPSPALLNVPSPNSTFKSDTRAQEQARTVSASSCASGAEADTEQERDTSLDESDHTSELVARGAVFVPAKRMTVVAAAAAEETGSEVKRKQSPVPASRKKEGDKPQDSSLRRVPPDATTSQRRSVSPVAHVGNSGKNTAVPDVPQSVQGYDGGNVGVLGGGVKLGGGGVPSVSANSATLPVVGKQDHVTRSVSGQSTGRAAAKMRSTSSSTSAFAGGGSESETTIGSGTEGGKSVPGGGGNKKRRGRPQQSRSPNIPHSHSHDPNPPLPPTHNYNHQWSPVIPTHMHHPPTTGGMPGMLGGGIAGQPGSIGFPPGSTLGGGWQGYPGAVPSWAPRPQAGLGMPIHSPTGQLAHSPPYAFASSSTGKHATSPTTRPIMGPAAPSHPEYSSQGAHWSS